MVANAFTSDYDRPLLRWPLEVKRVQEKGQDVIVLVDPLGVAANPAVIPAPLMAIVARFDGSRTISEIAQQGAAHGITVELVARIAQQLREMYLLVSPESDKRLNEIRDDYNRAESRDSAFAGLIYPDTPQRLRDELEQYIVRSQTRVSLSRSPVALICPHIDYNRGWRIYASALAALKQTKRPDYIFLIGTSHQPGRGHFHLTDKHFQTPLGMVPVAKSLINELRVKYKLDRCFDDELLHKKEHSLELQLPLIAHRYVEEGFPEIIPVLVGSFHQFLLDGRVPRRDPQIDDFIASFAELIKSLRLSGKEVLFYGGIDLAHMGQHFGDSERISDAGLEQIEARDRELLHIALTSNEDLLLAHMASDYDARRICGFPSLYTMLAVMKEAGLQLQGQLIEYAQAVDKKTDCIVSFASACWYEL